MHDFATPPKSQQTDIRQCKSELQRMTVAFALDALADLHRMPIQQRRELPRAVASISMACIRY
ncbi:hypothetical protein APY04_2293 [Hyphomicrobium sulfonivorans]|uniref:Uncharacterized protein n=1 Tax=Hyphomicrobium sulfonivorans TaxID=121290 RepID=A0A109BDR8_HYPSL|nr:hypothetical protein APY04_2293 [Hyphomicrobium sulfonivorans]